LALSDARAHCDTLDGPVVKEARAALDAGDVVPVLKWVKKDAEAEIATAFKKAVAVRAKGGPAKELADTWFLETLVRIHRAGEGAPFTGLKPAGADLPHAVVAADKALAGTLPVETLTKHVSGIVADGIRERFATVAEAKKHAGGSVEAGRKYVEAYVEYVHYVERVAQVASGSAGHAHEGHAGGGD
jgi:hypothetical protein